MDIYEKLRKIEALIERTSSEGERRAAEEAKKRLQERVREQPMEFKVASGSLWEKRLFVALCHKYGYKTYRYSRQKYTTTMVRMPSSLMNDVVLPEVRHYAQILNETVNEITNGLIDKVHHGDQEETVIAGEISTSLS